MSKAAAITKERATIVARSIPCGRCEEYSFKRLKITPASEAPRKSIGEIWHVARTCGVCGAHDEMGLDAEGDLVYSM